MDAAERTAEPLTRPLLRVAEASALLGMSTRALYVWVADGTVPSDAVLRVGRRVYLRRNALLKWAAGENGAEPPGGANERR